jgi:hypothetical protein
VKHTFYTQYILSLNFMIFYTIEQRDSYSVISKHKKSGAITERTRQNRYATPTFPKSHCVVVYRHNLDSRLVMLTIYSLSNRIFTLPKWYKNAVPSSGMLCLPTFKKIRQLVGNLSGVWAHGYDFTTSIVFPYKIRKLRYTYLVCSARVLIGSRNVSGPRAVSCAPFSNTLLDFGL